MTGGISDGSAGEAEEGSPAGGRLPGELHAAGRTPGGLVGEARQDEEGAAAVPAGSGEEPDRHRTAVEAVDDPLRLLAEAAFGPTGNDRQVAAQTFVFFPAAVQVVHGVRWL